MYIAIRITVSYEFTCMHYPFLSSFDIPLDMVHQLQSNYQWCAGLALYLYNQGRLTASIIEWAKVV